MSDLTELWTLIFTIKRKQQRFCLSAKMISIDFIWHICSVMVLIFITDIAQLEFEIGTPRKVRKKLADKLKPSANPVSTKQNPI